MEPLIKSLKTFFTYLVKHDLKCQENLRKSVKPLGALFNESEHLRIVKKVGQNEIDEKLPDVKRKLISKINSALEEEMVLLHEILRDFSGSNKELTMKLLAVEKDCENNESLEIFKSTPDHPSPSTMIEWAQDAWKLYHTFYLQINAALKCLKYEDEKTVTNLQRAFKEDPEMKQQVQYMLAYTRLFIEDS